MNILLTHGYFLSEDAHEQRIMKPYAPLGILAISAYLKSKGFSVDVFDTTFSTMREFESHVNTTRPAVVGIYTNLMTKFNVLAMITKCHASGAFVVLGGPEPAPYAEEYLKRGADVIVSGEGELTMEELLPALAKQGPHRLHDVAGIYFCDDNGAVIRTAARAAIPDLDALPMLDRASINIQQYLDTWKTHHGESSLSLICARGCPYHCTWCSHAVYGETHRRYSPKRMADEVRMLIDTYHPDQLWYADDVFTIHHKWLIEFAGELEARNVKIPFECISRADRLTAPIMDLLQRMGCKRLWIGSESGSQDVLDAMRREVTVEQVQWATHELQKRGIEVGMFIMLGYEGETEKDIRATAQHLIAASPDIMLTTVAYPIKGTEYYSRVEKDIIARTDWDHRTDRDLTVRGRNSRRYYQFAQRWMHAVFEMYRSRKSSNSISRLLKAALNVGIGNMGMAFTRSEREK